MVQWVLFLYLIYEGAEEFGFFNYLAKYEHIKSSNPTAEIRKSKSVGQSLRSNHVVASVETSQMHIVVEKCL